MVEWNDILEVELKTHIEEFNRIYKCLNKQLLPKQETVDNHIKNIVAEFNNIQTIIHESYSTFLSKDEQQIANTFFSSYRDKLIRIFARVGSRIKVPIDGQLVDIKVLDLEIEAPEIVVMAQKPTELLRLSAQTINKNYAGDPLGLNAFINSINLLEAVTEAANIPTLKDFIISKLEGKALEAIPPEPATILEIKNALKANIRPDSSKIIEARMLALRNDNMSSQEFAKKAEELSDALKRTLIVEGISQIKATEMVIEKTVEMCRATARSNLVKSVLASSSFNDPKAVIAKLLVETNNETKERQVLNYRSDNNNRFSNNSFQRKFPTNLNPGNNSNYQNNKFRNPNRFNGFQNQNKFNGNRNKNYHNFQKNVNVRVTEAENSGTPQDLQLGDIHPEEN